MSAQEQEVVKIAGSHLDGLRIRASGVVADRLMREPLRWYRYTESGKLYDHARQQYVAADVLEPPRRAAS